MCELCSNDPEERKAAEQRQFRIAQSLSKLAKHYTDMGFRTKKPHSPDMEHISAQATNLIRDLVEDWI